MILCFKYSLGPLVAKVKEFQVETIVEALCTNMLSDKEQLKDISSIGLKTVINQLPTAPSQMSSSIVKKITSRLLNTIQKVISSISNYFYIFDSKLKL
jgi:cullin-associated NEDD8-dissociated protein 1